MKYSSKIPFLFQISWQYPQTSHQLQPCTGDLSMPYTMSRTKSPWPTLQFWTHCLTWKSKCTTPQVLSPPRTTSRSLHQSCPLRWPSPCWRMRPWTWRVRVWQSSLIRPVPHLAPSTLSGATLLFPIQVIPEGLKHKDGALKCISFLYQNLFLFVFVRPEKFNVAYLTQLYFQCKSTLLQTKSAKPSIFLQPILETLPL